MIIGLGATGIEVAKRSKSFDMPVIAVTKHPPSKKRQMNIGIRMTNDNTNENRLMRNGGAGRIVEVGFYS